MHSYKGNIAVSTSQVSSDMLGSLINETCDGFCENKRILNKSYFKSSVVQC